MEYEQQEYMSCPQCRGEGYLLGLMGRLAHYRCRDCGWVWSEKAEG